jgi:hypothetical protein
MPHAIPLALVWWLAVLPLAAAQEPAPDDRPLAPDPVAADPMPEPLPAFAEGPDEQTGYYYVFAFVASAAELIGGAALGASVTGLVDGYGRRTLAASMATTERADAIRGDADGLATFGWIALGLGSVVTGAGFALDYYLGDEFGADDWWVRVCLTTPIAAAGLAMITGGVLELDRASFYDDTALDLPTAAAREAAQTDAASFSAAGWSLIGVGSAAILAGGIYWLWDLIEADDRDAEPTESDATAVMLTPLASPGGYGFDLSLTF